MADAGAFPADADADAGADVFVQLYVFVSKLFLTKESVKISNREGGGVGPSVGQQVLKSLGA